MNKCIAAHSSKEWVWELLHQIMSKRLYTLQLACTRSIIFIMGSTCPANFTLLLLLFESLGTRARVDKGGSYPHELICNIYYASRSSLIIINYIYIYIERERERERERVLQRSSIHPAKPLDVFGSTHAWPPC